MILDSMSFIENDAMKGGIEELSELFVEGIRPLLLVELHPGDLLQLLF
jgi:hypothetical protein